MTQSEQSGADVARYYDDNTRWFLRIDPSRARVIHRPVWAAGVRTLADAAHYVHARISSALPARRPLRLLDLGCGVGESSFWLAEHARVETLGISISEKQIAIAETTARTRGLAERCAFRRGDFMDLGALPAIDAAFAIEAFAHASDAAKFFAEAARVLPSGAPLFLCDDFVAGTPSPERAECLARLAKGWHFHSLFTRDEVVRLAEAAGFRLERVEVLTPHLRLHSSPLLSLLERAGGAIGRMWPSSLVDNMIGGTALQQSERRGWTEYALLELRRG
ncbi:MAG: methyltransferase domain-containing protein [Deltaproteobacteria bacterium]|nr:methyltransferase domain-containing protein [Deltaproteobacteria bacterium]